MRRYGLYFMVHEHDLDAAEIRSAKHRYWALFFSRLLPVVRTYGGFVAGLLRMPVVPFVLITFAGSFLWSALFIALGVSLGEHWHEIRRPAEIAGMAIVVLMVGLLFYATLRALRRAEAA